MLSPSHLERFLLCLLIVTGLAQAQSAAQSLPKSITLSYEVLGSSASSATPLATVNYDPRTLNYVLASWTPPSLDSLKSTSSEPTSAPLLRILLPNGSATVASLSAFDNKLSQDINIWLSQENDEVVSASVISITPPPLTKEQELQQQKEERLKKRGKAVPSTKPKPKSKKTKTQDVAVAPAGPVVRVNLLVANDGVKPKLNSRKPVQVDAEGQEVVPEEQQEKSFFQKYWYILLAVAFVLMSSSGGGDK
ncbi:hypothetical protein H2198_009026 [Neophaeococcomyces mojaviensis]|uniref:Uncharacterized protein n=1 Tax=Neophaeococcomyces mojaviensis TaxID=3383035 RepID=A0ACC2ZVZ8_9EURO|nr:hypothetical protein H2198_009026 [Knufia sp. JES_112]